MSDFPIPDSPNNTVRRFSGRVKSRTSTSTLSCVAIRMLKLRAFIDRSQVVSLHQTIRNLIDTEQRKHDEKRNADSLKVLEQKTRRMRRTPENRPDCEDILLAVELRKHAPESHRKIAQPAVGGESDRDNEIDRALEKDRDAEDGYHLAEEMGAAVLPQDFPVDDASLLDAAAE